MLAKSICSHSSIFPSFWTHKYRIFWKTNTLTVNDNDLLKSWTAKNCQGEYRTKYPSERRRNLLVYLKGGPLEPFPNGQVAEQRYIHQKCSLILGSIFHSPSGPVWGCKVTDWTKNYCPKFPTVNRLFYKKINWTTSLLFRILTG